MFLTKKDLVIESLNPVSALNDVIFLVICDVLIQAVGDGLEVGG